MTAVLIAPDGGHSALWMNHERYNIAKLKYRLAREKGSTYTVQETSLPDT